MSFDFTVSSLANEAVVSSAGPSSGAFVFGQPRRILTPARADPSSTLFVVDQPNREQLSQNALTTPATPSETAPVHNTWTSAEEERVAWYERRADRLDRLNPQPFAFVPPPMPTPAETAPMEEAEEDAEELFSQID